MTLLEPWVLICLIASAAATFSFGYAAVVGARVLAHAHVEAATEGRLALERQFELAATLLRVGALFQVFATLVSIVAADRLSGSLRGAMCGYGVFAQNRWGFLALGVGLASSLAAGVALELLSLDRRVRGLDLMRSLATLAVGLAPAVALGFGLTMAWLTKLDLSVTASCCSTTLDAARRDVVLFWQGPRAIAAIGALGAVPLAAGTALFARSRPGRAPVALSGFAALLALPFAIGAVVLEVAPHVYEVPEHLCPFCLFKGDAFFIGYPLFAAIFLATTWGLGAAAAALLCTGSHVRDAFPSFARSRMAREALAWGVALALGAAPVVLHVARAPGASLFR
jgi:hypothetical protein